MAPGPPKHPISRVAPPDFVRGAPLEEAWELAVEAHGDQTRTSDEQPYMLHPVEVAELLRAEGVDEPELLAATLLHDVAEDTDVTLEQIEERFGPGVGDLVRAMTEDEDIEPYVARKEDHRAQVEAAGERVVAMYAADKLAKLRELRALYAAEGDAAAPRFKAPIATRIELWHGDVEMIERAAPRLGILRELRDELAGFEREYSAAGG